MPCIFSAASWLLIPRNTSLLISPCCKLGSRNRWRAFVAFALLPTGEFITGLPNDEMVDCMASYVVDQETGQFRRISFVWLPRSISTQMDAAAVKVVEQQLEAYNARDVDAFMSIIHENVQVRIWVAHGHAGRAAS